MSKKGFNFSKFLFFYIFMLPFLITQAHAEKYTHIDRYKSAAEQGAVRAQYIMAMSYRQGKGVKEDVEQAAYWFEKAARQGDLKSQIMLYSIYRYGIGVKSDEKVAVRWLKKVATYRPTPRTTTQIKQRINDAQYQLGLRYAVGRGVAIDQNAAANWFEKAAQSGHKLAQYQVAMRHLLGLTSAPDAQNTAFLYLNQAASGEHPFPRAQNQLGLYFEQQNLFSKAVTWYRKAANADLASAQYNLGNMYLKGLGIQKDWYQAAYWFKKAAEKGSIRAQNNLGVLFAQDKELMGDKAQSFSYYQSAAQQGHAIAQYNLGMAYLEGTLTTKNTALAWKWLNSAKAQKVVAATYQIALMYEQGIHISKNDAKALELLQIAARANYAPAQYQMALRYEQGRGVKKSPEQAFAQYKKVAEQGDLTAQVKVASMYEKGQGIGQKFAQAAKWYEKAAEQNHIASMRKISFMLQHGQGLAQDQNKAFEWMNRAAKLDDAQAQFELAQLYQKGIGTQIDITSAMGWYGLAQESGIHAAKIALDTVYEKASKNLNQAHPQSNIAGLFDFSDMNVFGSCAERSRLVSSQKYLCQDVPTDAPNQLVLAGQMTLSPEDNFLTCASGFDYDPISHSCKKYTFEVPRLSCNAGDRLEQSHQACVHRNSYQVSCPSDTTYAGNGVCEGKWEHQHYSSSQPKARATQKSDNGVIYYFYENEAKNTVYYMWNHYFVLNNAPASTTHAEQFNYIYVADTQDGKPDEELTWSNTVLQYFNIKRKRKPFLMHCLDGYTLNGTSCYKDEAYPAHAYCAEGVVSADHKQCVITQSQPSTFDYPIYEYEQDESSLSIAASSSEQGRAILQLPIEGTQSELYFQQNQFKLFGLESLQKSAHVKVDWEGDLKQVRVSLKDKNVFYYFQTAPWDMRKTEYVPFYEQEWRTNYLLTHVGMCTESKTTYRVTCRKPLKLDYKRSKEETGLPFLVKAYSPINSYDFKYNDDSILSYVTQIHEKDTRAGVSNQTEFSYQLDAEGLAESKLSTFTSNLKSMQREEVTYAIQPEFKGLVTASKLYSTLQGKEYLSKSEKMDWILGKNDKALKYHHVLVYYNDHEVATMTIKTTYQYDDLNRIIEKSVYKSNHLNEAIEEVVSYQYQGAYVSQKIESKSVHSSAFEGGISDFYEKTFTYSYDDKGRLIGQTSKQGDHEIVEQTQYNDKNLPTLRQVWTNGEKTLEEQLIYEGARVSRRCENNVCIDYTYEIGEETITEKSFYKGMLFEKTVSEGTFPISKTIRGVTKNTRNYAVDKVPQNLQAWLGACPADTKMFSYIDQPQEAICTTEDGRYSVKKSLNDRFIISGEQEINPTTKHIYQPHFLGESNITYIVEQKQDVDEVQIQKTGDFGTVDVDTAQVFDTHIAHVNRLGDRIAEYTDIAGNPYRIIDENDQEIRLYYDIHGNITKSILNKDPKTAIRYTYNDAGQKTSVIDPIKGKWNYRYNARGMISWQKDANGDETYFSYDRVGRLEVMSTPYKTLCYSYPKELPSSTPQSITQVRGRHASCSGKEAQYKESRQFSWPQGWITQSTIQMPDGKTYVTRYEYDKAGHLITQHLPTALNHQVSLAVDYKNGVAYRWRNAKTHKVYKTIIEEDAAGRVKEIVLGNGIREFYTYSEEHDVLTSIHASRDGMNFYHFDFVYDESSRLTERKRTFYYRSSAATSITDAYVYQGRYLTQHTITQLCVNDLCKEVSDADHIEHTSDYTFDTYGNLTSKTGVGDYIYDTDKPNQLVQIDGEMGEQRFFIYDANGNMLSDGIRDFKYEMNQLVEVSYQGQNTIDKDQTRFIYGADGQRLVRVDKRFDAEKNKYVEKRTRYVGAYSYRTSSDGPAQESYAGDGFSLSCQEDQACEVTYVHTDRLENQFMLTNENGDILSQTFIDPYGATHKVLLPETASGVFLSHISSNSFGQEGIEGFDLTHMNGRIYDPILGRFLQADPHVDGIKQIIGYNRYAYMHNDPVNGVDPTGYLFGFVKKIFRKAKKVVKKASRFIGGVVKKVWHAAKKFVKKVVVNVARVVGKVVQEVAQVVYKAGKVAFNIAKEAARVTINTVARVGEAVVHVAKKSFEVVKKVAQKVIDIHMKMIDYVHHVAVEITKPFREMVIAITPFDFLKDIMKSIDGLVTTPPSQLIKIAIENPELVLGIAAAAYLGPIAFQYFAGLMFPAATAAATAASTTIAAQLSVAQMAAVSAATGAVTGATSHLIMNKGRIKNIHKSMLTGAAGGAIAGSVAHGLYGLDSSTPLYQQDFSRVAGSTLTKALANAAVSKVVYGDDVDFDKSFLASTVTGLMNVGVGSLELGDTASIALGGAVSGLVSTEIYGGDFNENFMRGFMNGYTDMYFNDLAGDVVSQWDELSESIGNLSTGEKLSMAVDNIPIVGNIKSIVEITTGYDVIAMKKISDQDRKIAAATMLIPGPAKTAAKLAARVKKLKILKAKSQLKKVDQTPTTSCFIGKTLVHTLFGHKKIQDIELGQFTYAPMYAH